jgi:hypothetical protein
MATMWQFFKKWNIFALLGKVPPHLCLLTLVLIVSSILIHFTSITQISKHLIKEIQRRSTNHESIYERM